MLSLPILKGRVGFHLCDVYPAIHPVLLVELLGGILDMVQEPNIIPICMKRGQTLFFSGQLIHGSEPNYSHTRSRRTFIGHYVDNMTENLAKFYHPVLDMQGQVVSHVSIDQNGGPCQEVK